MQYSVPGRPPQLHSLPLDNSLSRNETMASQGVLVINTQEGRQVADEGTLNLADLEPQVSDKRTEQFSLNVQPYCDQLLLFSGPTTSCQAKPLVKMSSLAMSYFYLLHGNSSKVFTDRKLPTPKQIPVPDEKFDFNYFTTLSSSMVSAPGPTWPAGTPNYRGARVSLIHITASWTLPGGIATSEFNGVELMYRDQPLDLTLEQLLDRSAVVNCGDAQTWGGGSFYDDEYWSHPFPQWLQSPDILTHIKEFYVVLASCQPWSKHEFSSCSDSFITLTLGPLLCPFIPPCSLLGCFFGGFGIEQVFP